jgi:hypothetical protein
VQRVPNGLEAPAGRHARPEYPSDSRNVKELELIHTEIGRIEGELTTIGRDPRRMSEADLNAVGHERQPLLRAVRANCIECTGGSEAEVRRCRLVACVMWPYRMGTNPFFHRELDGEQRLAASARMAALRKRSPSSNQSGRQEKEHRRGSPE